MGAQVVFKDGRPEKRLYRSYIIRGAAAGDTEALKEVLSRRFRQGAASPTCCSSTAACRSWGRPGRSRTNWDCACDLLALAKGEERVFLEDGSSLVLEPRDPAAAPAAEHPRRGAPPGRQPSPPAPEKLPSLVVAIERLTHVTNIALFRVTRYGRYCVTIGRYLLSSAAASRELNMIL